MLLIGMLDSPYVRRVAIGLLQLGLPFEHRALSVFRNFDAFSGINPVVKAPTLVCDDHTVLMDSSLILRYAESLAPPRRLLPVEPTLLADRLAYVGLALAACEKSVQIVYERGLRPPDKQHEAWLQRVTGQLQAACQALETRLVQHPLPPPAQAIDDAGISVAVAWHFIAQMVPGSVPAGGYPALQAYSAAAEALSAFQAAPYGDGVVQHALMAHQEDPPRAT